MVVAYKSSSSLLELLELDSARILAAREEPPLPGVREPLRRGEPRNRSLRGVVPRGEPLLCGKFCSMFMISLAEASMRRLASRSDASSGSAMVAVYDGLLSGSPLRHRPSMSSSSMPSNGAINILCRALGSRSTRLHVQLKETQESTIKSAAQYKQRRCQDRRGWPPRHA